MTKINWKTFWYTNLFSLMTLLTGIILTAKPDIITSTCKLVGSLCCIIGIILLVLHFLKKQSSQNMTYGIVFLIAGILLGTIPTMLKMLIPILFGGWILTSSLSGMHRNFLFRNDVPKWWIGFGLCAVSAALAIFIMTRPISVMNDTVRIIGIGFILHAVIRLISSILGKEGYKSASENTIETTIQE